MCSIVPFAVAWLAYTSVACAGKCTFSSPYSAHIRTLQRMPQNCSVRADAHPMSYSNGIGSQSKRSLGRRCGYYLGSVPSWTCYFSITRSSCSRM